MLYPGTSANSFPSLARGLCLLLAIASLAACSSRPPAPVIERSTDPVRNNVPVDGYYSVKKGDSLHAIAFRYGLDVRDLARWNRLDSPDLIYPDQVLRLTEPPASTARSASVTTQAAPPPRATTRADTRPLEVPKQPVSKPVSKPASQPAAKPAASTPPPVATPKPATTPPVRPASQPVVKSAGGTQWAWPVDGRVIRTFKSGDPSRNGLDIVGKEGQKVRAAASGQVVYSGNGLIGYGELIIIKHSDTLLSAYAHNRRRLVAEGDNITQGQEIAEMGRNDRNQQMLHFEIRSNGKPVDPNIYLPKQ